MVKVLLAGIFALFAVNAAQAAEGQPGAALLKAGEKGVVEAQLLLGAQYLLGHGVRRDPGAARQWYRKAADQGHPKAQTILGLLYMNGAGVEADASQAAVWFRLAALQGSAEAQLSLGTLYAVGDGVPQDLVEAHMWVTLAAVALPPGENRTTAIQLRQGLSGKMTEEQLERATERAEQMWVFSGNR
jgi:hypothetical protein